MAEARVEDEEEDLRETRDPVVRRNPRLNNSSSDRPDRHKPEHRLSQGPLSSIRAVIKRTSTRSTSLSESHRERHRPEITILSAEPLAATSWFTGASGGLTPPPPPPPAAQIWGPTIPPVVQPPPSYEEVIREKTQEQPPPTPSRRSVTTTTIATQTDSLPRGSAPNLTQSVARRPAKPPRPSSSLSVSAPRSSTHSDLNTHSTTHTHSDLNTHSTTHTHSVTHTHSCPDLLSDLFSPLSSGDQTDQWEPPTHVTVTTPSDPPPDPPRPRPRPRSKASLCPISCEVKVQTLVRLRDDGQTGSEITNQEGFQGKYLQELLEAFSSDDWGFDSHRSDGSGQSEEEEEEEEEHMAALRARIQAFEQQRTGSNHGDGNLGNTEAAVVARRPEPRPRALKPALPIAPPIAPKPQSKAFWENRNPTVDASLPKPTDTPSPPHSPTITASPALSPSPNLTPAPTPAPRPTSSRVSPTDLPSLPPRPPPRPPAGPRASAVPSSSSSSLPKAPATPPRPAVTHKPFTLTSGLRASGDCSTSAPKPGPQPPSSAPKPAMRPPAPASSPASTSAPAQRKTLASKPESPSPDPPLPPRPSEVKNPPLRPAPIRVSPGRPPPPKAGPANQTQGQRASRRGPPLPPRPTAGHPLFNSYMKQEQEVLVVLEDTSPAPTESLLEDKGLQGSIQVITPLSDQSKPLLDLDYESEHVDQSEPVCKDKSLSELQSVLPAHLSNQSNTATTAPVRFDCEAADQDELTSSQGDVIALTEVIGQDWGRGQVNGQAGLLPLSFTQEEELSLSSGKRMVAQMTSELIKETNTPDHNEGWEVALFDFPGQTAGDLSFLKGALIRVTQRVDADWSRGRLGSREGIYPSAFTHTWRAQPIEGQTMAVGVAQVLFDFSAESEDELTLKAGDLVTGLQAVDDDWFIGDAEGRRGLVPKNYISLLT